MDCDVAREALSARLDGEREPVPSARVDEHLTECAACHAWFDHASNQTSRLRRLAESRPAITPVESFGLRQVPTRRRRLTWQRWALLGAGVAQIALAVAQGLGLSVGSPQGHGMSHASHLLNESTAWSVALGVAMVVAALWPGAAAGLAGVLAVFVGVLGVYAVGDTLSGTVTTARLLTHVPVVIGAVLATLVWRSAGGPPRGPDTAKAPTEPDIVLPEHASRGRRRGHLWPTDGIRGLTQRPGAGQ